MAWPSGASPLQPMITRVPGSAVRRGRDSLVVVVTARPYPRAGPGDGRFSPGRGITDAVSIRTREAPPRRAVRLEQHEGPIPGGSSRWGIGPGVEDDVTAPREVHRGVPAW